MGLKPLRLLPLLLFLSACGYKGQLTRIDTKGMEREAAKEARSAEQARVDRALTPTAEQRPVRVDDISVRLERRADDPFDLPPE